MNSLLIVKFLLYLIHIVHHYFEKSTQILKPNKEKQFRNQYEIKKKPNVNFKTKKKRKKEKDERDGYPTKLTKRI